MSKVYYFITITIGLTILMKLAGVPYAGSEQLIDWLGLDPNNLYVTSSVFFGIIIAMFGTAAAMGVVSSNREASLRAGISTGILGVGIGAFIGILQTVKNMAQGSQEWVFYIVFMIFVVYITGFIFAMIEFWGSGQ